MINNIYVAPGVPVTIVNGDTTIYLNNNKKGKDKRMKRKTEMGICPACDNDDCEMVDMEMDVDCLWTRWRCNECGEEWCEYASLTYDGYSFNGKTYDADGKECTDI